MKLIQLGIRTPDGRAPTETDAALIQDILWALSGPVFRLEHIRARACPHAVSLSILLADGVQDPLEHVLRLVEAAISNSTYLSGWQTIRPALTTNEGSDE
jgi:hypothetical protein